MNISPAFATRKSRLVEDFHIEQAGCQGKHRFDTPQAARRAIHRQTDAAVTHYRCAICGGFHVGARKKRRRIKYR